MAKKIVTMTAIPGVVRRGLQVRSDLSYAKYGEATWRWWCWRHGIEFVLFNVPLAGDGYAMLPPTIQRWVMLNRLMREVGEDVQVAAIDADTMIRWDAPDFFEIARGFSAVIGGDPFWIAQSIRAFQPVFPGISLPWWEYFNSGLVVLGPSQRRFIHAFTEFTARQWPTLEPVIRSSNVGTDQTPMNFAVRLANEPVFGLPRPFNYLNCIPMDDELMRMEGSAEPDPGKLAAKLEARPRTLNFIDLGYVWHFTNVLRLRPLIMRETWRRVRHNYPGIEIAE